MPYKPTNFVGAADRWASTHAFRFLCVLPEDLPSWWRGVPSWWRGVHHGGVACHHGNSLWELGLLSVIHFLALSDHSPWGHSWVASDKRHCKQWTSSLFLWIFASSLYPRPVPLTYQPRFVKTDLYPLSQGLWCLSGMLSVRRWSIIGRCFGACNKKLAI